MKKESEPRYKSKHAKRARNRVLSVVLVILILITWTALFYGGYYYLDLRLVQMEQETKNYLQSIQETNALNIQNLEEQIRSLQQNISEISMALEQADQTLNKSNSTREALTERIDKLDQQLEELRHSLNILQELNNETH